MNVGRLIVRIDADIENFEKNLSEVAGATRRLGQHLQDVGKSLTVGVTLPITALGAASVKMASDAAESANKFNVVMGSAAGDVRAELLKLYDTVPLTTGEMENLAAGIQDMLVPMGVAREEGAMMSANMIKLAGDIGSFNNVHPEQVLEAMKSALAGSSEPMRQFGVDTRVAALEAIALEHGLIGLGESMDSAAMAEAVMIAIQKDSTDAMGDAARTAGEFSNSVKYLVRDAKELATTFGNILIPIVAPLVGWLKNVVNWIQDMSPVTQTAIVVVAGLAAAMGPLILGVGTFMAMLPVMTLGLSGVGVALAALSGPIGLTAGALAAAYLVWNKWGEDIKRIVRETVASVREWLVDRFGNIVNVVIGKLEWIGEKFAWLYRLVGGTVSDIATAAKNFVLPTAAMAQTTGEAANNLGAAANAAAAAGDTIRNKVVVPTKEALEAAEKMAKTLKEIGAVDINMRGTRAATLAEGPKKLAKLGDAGTRIPERLDDASEATLRTLLDLQDGARELGVGWEQAKQQFTRPADTVEGAMQMLNSSVLGVAQEFTPLGLVARLLNGAFEVLWPTIDMLLEPVTLLGEMIGGMLVPVVRILIPPLKFVAKIMSYLGTAIGWLIRGIGKALNKLPGSIGDPLVRMGQTMMDSAEKMRADLDAVGVDAAAEGAATALDKLTDSVLNAVSGFKVEAYRHAAARGSSPTSGGALTPQGANTAPSAPVNVGGIQINTTGDGRETYRGFYEELDQRTRGAEPEARALFLALPAPV